jgi:cytochrome c oxidase subunit 3
MSATALSARRRETDAAVGLLVLLGSLAMLFAALLLAYAIVRAQAPRWPPPGSPPLPRAAAGANTLWLVAASAALRRARRAAGRSWVVVAAALGAGFLAGQISIWRHLVQAGLGPHGQMPGQVFLALSALHAVHLLAGLVALAVSRRVRLLSMYWDFLLVVWLVLYAAVCWI